MSNTRKIRRPPNPHTPRAPRTPRCVCDHGTGPDPHPCGRPAYIRVTVVCTEPGCEDAAASCVLCGACVDQWLEWAASDGGFPELRIAAL